MAGSDASGTQSDNCATAPLSGEVELRAALHSAGPVIRRYLYGVCGNWHEAEDLTQDALLKAWNKRSSFDGRCKVQTWIFTIARNHWRDRLRRRRVRPQETAMDQAPIAADPQPGPPALAQRGELAQAVEIALADLPEAQREALALRESQGLTFEQIGQLLGVPAATIKSRVRYALMKLADALKPFGRELES